MKNNTPDDKSIPVAANNGVNASNSDATQEHNRLIAAQGEFVLERNPMDKTLKAWEAADEYLLKYLDENTLVSPLKRVLIVNDAFGGLSVALADYRPTMMSDSFLAEQALAKNLSRNGINPAQVKFENGLQTLQPNFDLILIKIPKSLALLEAQLLLLRASILPDTRVLAAGMSRAVHKSTLQLFETLIGPTTTSLAWKKARLIFVDPSPTASEPESQDLACYTVETDREFIVSSQAGVFSGNRLDPGSRLLIENMPRSEHYEKIADLGCGNGVIGIIAASLSAQARLVFVDESYQAVASAKQNFIRAFGAGREADFQVTNCFQGIANDSLDLVLNNPPFHQQQTIGDAIAWQMFVEARRVLKPEAELWVVGNRHLGYHAKLRKIFGRCEVVQSNQKFVLLRAVKRKLTDAD